MTYWLRRFPVWLVAAAMVLVQMALSREENRAQGWRRYMDREDMRLHYQALVNLNHSLPAESMADGWLERWLRARVVGYIQREQDAINVLLGLGVAEVVG